MRIRRRTVSKEDFGDDLINQYSSLSPLDCLAIVAQKALEKETAFSSTSFLGIPMVEREQHKPMNVIKRKLFECQATHVEENTMVEQQLTSSGNPKFKRSKLPEIEKTAPKPGIPITIVEDEENAMKPVKRNKAPSYPTDNQCPVLPHDFRELIFSLGGSDPVMVLQKKLFKCDVDKGQGRVTMPVRECGTRLSLTEEEKQMLEVRDKKDSLVGIRVKVIEPGLRERELTFKKWNYKENTSSYVLVNSWFEVVVKNELKDGDEIQIWAFRINGKLAFALVKLPTSSKNNQAEVDQHSSFAFKIRRRIVSKEDFGDDLINQYASLSPLDCLAIVAQKALEKETALSSTSIPGIPMVEREQHQPMNVIKRKLFECQATHVEENPMVEQQFTSSGNPKFKRSKLPETEKTAPKPSIPITMVEIEENAMNSTKGNKAPSYPMDTQFPVLPHNFRELIFSMGGSDPVMVLQKKLFKSDVDKGQGRVTMPVRECGTRLSLTEEEKQMLEVRDKKDSLVGIRVKVIEPGLRERELTFKKWNYKENTSSYVLVNSWFEVVVKNELKDGDEIQIWAFRINGKLALALVKLPTSSKNSQAEVNQLSSLALNPSKGFLEDSQHDLGFGSLFPHMEHRDGG
ncbi:hypothetical protein Cgig2_019996 [Carnegiea gigantea]|uniref:B3 domain-containing protein n=1 Tax=Carnegiea gigantea TaxID=171969 RepID=A0A9Q1QG65_9CARY|nr:hypothetical protein Cgig2_019996 [Carnegiea gigantea]